GRQEDQGRDVPEQAHAQRRQSDELGPGGRSVARGSRNGGDDERPRGRRGFGRRRLSEPAYRQRRIEQRRLHGAWRPDRDAVPWRGAARREERRRERQFRGAKGKAGPERKEGL
ncbi:MAG: hypothetical protein AVDCRST_MAG23-2236, partial [uncultured Sphingosinicella sp.]